MKDGTAAMNMDTKADDETETPTLPARGSARANADIEAMGDAETPDVPGTLTGARREVHAQVLLIEANLAEVKDAIAKDGPDQKVRLNAEAGLVGASKAMTDLRAAIKQIGAKEPTP